MCSITQAYLNLSNLIIFERPEIASLIYLPAELHFSPPELPSKIEIGRVHFSDADEDLDLECEDEENDEETFVELALLQDGHPTLLQVPPVKHAGEKVAASTGF